MKINWGSSIVIAFALFMSFILYFVFMVQSDSKYDNELVVEEYYKYDANFQQEMEKVQNAQDSQLKPDLSSGDEGVRITFPEELIAQNITGTISLYRPSNKKLDFKIPISLSARSILIPRSDLAGGRWNLTMAWKYENTDYILKETLYIN